jgi:hypothetical protein
MSKQHYLEKQLKEYEVRIPMTKYERSALRKWVRDVHSVYEAPGSKYLPDAEENRCDFLDVYRQDKEIEEAISGMTGKEQVRWLKDYVGYEEPVAPTQIR